MMRAHTAKPIDVDKKMKPLGRVLRDAARERPRDREKRV